MAGGMEFIRRVGSEPRYGSGKPGKTYHLDAARPVGPELAAWRCGSCGQGLRVSDRRCPACGAPYRTGWAERRRRARIVRARHCLLLLGTLCAIWAVWRVFLVSVGGEDDLSAHVAPFAAAFFLALAFLAVRRPVVPLLLGLVGTVVLTPFAVFLLFTYGSDIAGVWVLQSPIPAVALALLLGMIVALAAGVRAALTDPIAPPAAP